MITALFKHEILRTWRWLGLLTLGAALVVSAATLLAMIFPAPVNLAFGVVAIIVAALYPFAVQLLISLDFYRSCYSKTGYFTAAIPEKGSTIFGVKALYAYLVSLLALVLDLGLLLIAAIGIGSASGIPASATIDTLFSSLAMVWELPAWLLVSLIVIVVFLPLTGITPYFFAATVGSEAWINRSGFGGVVLVWFLFYLASQLVGVAAVFLAPVADLNAFPDVTVFYDPMRLATAANDAQYLPLGIFGWMLVMAVVGMWWAKVSYSRKLELR